MELSRTQVNQLRGITWGASKDWHRPILRGVQIIGDSEAKTVTAVATDSYMLAIRRWYVDDAPDATILVDAALLRKVLMLDQRASNNITMEWTDTILEIGQSTGVHSYLKPINGTFPKWQNLMEREYSNEIPNTRFSIELMNKALKTAGGTKGVELAATVPGHGPRVWHSFDAGVDPMEGEGWWCLLMPTR